MTDQVTATDDGARGGLNRRQAIGLAGAAAAAATGAGVASASSAAASAKDSDEVVAMPSVSLELAEEIVEAAVEYTRDQGFPPMYITVVDVCGDQKAAGRMDGNGAASVALAPAKATTAAAFRRSTADLGANVTDPAAVASFTTAGFSLLGGGVPIRVGDQVVGAVGVGGGSPQQDDEVAQAALSEVLD